MSSVLFDEQDGDNKLHKVRKAIKGLLGRGSFETYLWTIDSFLTGKLSKPELDFFLKSLLDPVGAHLKQLHNQYMMMILERISKIQTIAKIEDGIVEDLPHSRSFKPKSIILTKQDINVINEALTKPSLESQDLGKVRTDILRNVLMTDNSANSNPTISLLSQFSGVLPSKEVLRERLIMIGKAHGLSEARIVDEDIAVYLAQALEQYLKRTLHSFADSFSEGLQMQATLTEQDIDNIQQKTNCKLWL